MTCLGVLERGERGDGYETCLKEGGVLEMSTTQCLKEGGVIEMSTTVLPYTRCTLSSLDLLTKLLNSIRKSRFRQ